jgi:NADPH2:quinone reductase
VVAAPLESRFAIGDRVMGITAFAEGCGGYADYAYVREQSTINVPTAMTDEEAGGFPIAFRTAHAALIERGGVSAGEVLVVLGAAGSSGSAAVQLGKALGATVVAVAGSDEKLEFCRRMGADHLVNYRSGALLDEVAAMTGGRGADVIFDPVGGTVGQQALQALRRYGRHLIVGLASGATVPVESTDLLMRNVSAVGVYAGGFTPEEDGIAWTRLSTLAGSGQIRTPVGSTYDFTEVPAMVTRLASPPPGKSIVMMN